MAASLSTTYDRSKIFIGENRYRTITYTNSTGSTVNLSAGRIIGREFTNKKAMPHVSTATDGSEFPIGVLADNYTVADGATKTLTYCFAGDIDQNKLIFGGSDTIDTLVSHTYTDSGTDTVVIKQGTILDLLIGRTQLIPVVSTEQTS